MSKTCEHWDATSRNSIAACACESEALANVRAYVDEHGPGYAESWVLLWDDDEADRAEQIADGPALLVRAERARPPHEAATAKRRAG